MLAQPACALALPHGDLLSKAAGKIYAQIDKIRPGILQSRAHSDEWDCVSEGDDYIVLRRNKKPEGDGCLPLVLGFAFGSTASALLQLGQNGGDVSAWLGAIGLGAAGVAAALIWGVTKQHGCIAILLAPVGAAVLGGAGYLLGQAGGLPGEFVSILGAGILGAVVTKFLKH